uniref:Uncharacterized protein n=1 Tax=Oryza punctata TaxID=4537 RepID=A0A0E0LVH1_ORYPU
MEQRDGKREEDVGDHTGDDGVSRCEGKDQMRHWTSIAGGERKVKKEALDRMVTRLDLEGSPA